MKTTTENPFHSVGGQPANQIQEVLAGSECLTESGKAGKHGAIETTIDLTEDLARKMEAEHYGLDLLLLSK